ncbi:hypothetical protein G3I40_13280, partial [Streptomyces sp. SID14478]|nr:hypothetical protein [Streptomyces sp. SID14478]
AWVCTRAETWRGGGPRTLALFRAPGARTAVVAAKSEGSAACGVREPLVLAGVRWKSRAGNWYLIAGGSKQVGSVSAAGSTASGNVLAVRTTRSAQTSLTGRTTEGAEVATLR